MNRRSNPRSAHRVTRQLPGCLLALGLLIACHPAPPSVPGGGFAEPVETADARNTPNADEHGVTLTVDQVEKLGITVEPAAAVEHRAEATGYGVVLNHDVIAQATADLVTAKSTARLSRSALERALKLKHTPGAVSADVEETAAQKAEVDAAVLTATQQKLSSILGMSPPWKQGDTGGTVQALASGRFKLLRATFPWGMLQEGRQPTTLRIARNGMVNVGPGWQTTAVWSAPADTAMPGRSFFGLLETQEVQEGEHLQVFEAVGEFSAGFIVPAAAAVLNQGQYWCYVQRKPGVFGRVKIDVSAPVAAGYFVKEGVQAGDAIVTRAAGLLLAKEIGGTAEPDQR